MKAFKYISIENHELISKKVYEYIRDHTDILNKQWNKEHNPTLQLCWIPLKMEVLRYVPELYLECKKITDANIKYIVIIYREPDKNPNGDDGVHIDSEELVRLLWPISNCNGSRTRFFDVNGNTVEKVWGVSGDWYYRIDRDRPLIEIDSFELSQPLIFNSGVPHGIYTDPNNREPRLSMTIAFDRDMSDYLK